MIRERVREVQERVAAACRRVGRDPATVTLVCVTKQAELGQIEQALAAGISDVGENRVQEARGKHATLAARYPQLRWHLIGHLQSNKAKSAASFFHCIHSIDSSALAKALERQLAASSPPRRLDVLVEVNTSGEAAKYGVAPDAAPALVEAIRQLPHLRVTGLMTMAPVVDDPNQARPFFSRLRALRDALGLPQLSMGMSQDYDVAIEEGATMVRVGTAIFGTRA